MAHHATHLRPSTPIAPITLWGFFAGLVLWFTWFATHLPWAGVPEQVALPVVLSAWLVALTYAGYRVGPTKVLQVTVGAGLIAAVLGLLILGSRLTEKTEAQHASMIAATVKPHAGLIVLGFLATGAVLGAFGGFIGSKLPGAGKDARATAEDLLPRFALVACATTAPLLFIGGLVTSTNSGMAVPDWPNSYGSNMFLYPLGPRAQGAPDMPANKIFLEHSHRLFGTLVGLATMAVMIWTWMSNQRKGLKVLATVAFALVVTQGVLGGIRVLQGHVDIAEDNRWYAMMHGVLGQLVFATQVFLAAKLFRLDRALDRGLDRGLGDALGKAPELAGARSLRLFATAALHSSVLQLLLGAAFRHFRHMHILWTHIAFALVVALLGIFAGFVAMNLGKRDGQDTLDTLDKPVQRSVRIARTLGVWGVVVVGLQFALGWVAFLAGGTSSVEAQTATQAIFRTVHQANGAAMLAVLVGLFVVGRAVSPKVAPSWAATDRCAKGTVGDVGNRSTAT
jgi:heme a synthase